VAWWLVTYTEVDVETMHWSLCLAGGGGRKRGGDGGGSGGGRGGGSGGQGWGMDGDMEGWGRFSIGSRLLLRLVTACYALVLFGTRTHTHTPPSAALSLSLPLIGCGRCPSR
jgi:hypothetical protein